MANFTDRAFLDYLNANGVAVTRLNMAVITTQKSWGGVLLFSNCKFSWKNNHQYLRNYVVLFSSWVIIFIKYSLPSNLREFQLFSFLSITNELPISFEWFPSHFSLSVFYLHVLFRISWKIIFFNAYAICYSYLIHHHSTVLPTRSPFVVF